MGYHRRIGENLGKGGGAKPLVVSFSSDAIRS